MFYTLWGQDDDKSLDERNLEVKTIRECLLQVHPIPAEIDSLVDGDVLFWEDLREQYAAELSLEYNEIVSGKPAWRNMCPLMFMANWEHSEVLTLDDV
jgi:hypothetical protein